MELSELLLILIAIIQTSMLPWAYKVGNRLTAIEVSLKETAALRAQITALTNAVHQIELRLAKMDNSE